MRLFSQDKMVCFVIFYSGQWRRFVFDNRTAPLAVFYQPRAPPLLKFWLSQNFKRLEESVMGFNCAQEKAKFDREWLRLRKEYTDAGMSEAAIQKIYEYDWYCFCRNRAYERRATQMPPLEIDSPDDARRSALFRKTRHFRFPLTKAPFQIVMHGLIHWRICGCCRQSKR